MDSYTIIEDVFGDEDGRNQITAARGFVGNSFVPDDMRPRRGVGRVSDRPNIPNMADTDLRMMGQPQPQRNDQNFSQETVPMFGNIPQGPTMYPGVDNLPCRDVFTHVENCPICSSYFKKDIKFYWLIIAILIVIILLLTRK